MQIKDIEIEFEGDALTKYGLFALLAWFLIDIPQSKNKCHRKGQRKFHS